MCNVPRKVCAPLRRPGSGDPELLDVEEYMQTTGNHEESLNTASNLGLMEESGEDKLLFMRLPSVPLVSTTETNIKGPGEKIVDLKALPKGFVGKLLVYKSGAVKMKLGEVLYDVSPGSKSGFAEDVMAVNTEKKCCCMIGDVYKHMQN